MKKILILTNSLLGLCSFRMEVVQKLAKKYQVMIGAPDEEGITELQKTGCRTVKTPMSRRGMNPFQDYGLYCRYKEIICAYTPDMVLLYTIKPNIYGGCACRRLHVPYISTITGLGTTFQKENLLKKAVTLMYRIGLRDAECIFFQNQSNSQIFDKLRICGKKSRLVSGSGVNLKKHAYEPYPEDGKIRFFAVGRIMKEKGIEEFLAAAQKFHSDKVSFEWIGGTYEEDYQEIMAEYDKKGIVTDHGHQSEMHTFYKQASALIHGSFHEGMSNVMMEAAATGRPVLASNVSGCKEIFEEGITGFGFEPGNQESLFAVIEKFLALPWEKRAEMGQLARKKMEREFDREFVIQAYMEEIQNLTD